MINNVDFFELEPEKYWSFPKNYKGDKTAEIKSMIFSGDYYGSLKKDGHYYRFVKDVDGKMSLQGRTRGVAGNFLNKIGHVPQLTKFFNSLPKGTCLLGELYFKNNPGSKKVTTIMGCGEEKAIKRQEDGEKLSYYVFDVWAFNGKSMLEIPIESRADILNKIAEKVNEDFVDFAEYKFGADLWELMNYAFENNEEGIVITKKGTVPSPGKRTARKTLKIKKELQQDLDVFLTGRYKVGKGLYTGKNIEDWTFWLNEKTDEILYGKLYEDYEKGRPIVPITKNKYYGWASSVEIGAYDEKTGEIKHIGFISGISDKIKEEIIDPNSEWRMKPCVVSAMEIDDESKLLRHGKILEFRDDISYKDCTIQKIFGEKE